MITPRLLRRSFRRALQWRFLLLWIAIVAIPAIAALAPAWRFLEEHLGHSPRAPQLVAALDSHAAADLLKRFIEPAAAASFATGAWTALLLALLCAPFGAAAALALARADEPLRFRALLAGAAEHYGRMLRTLLVSLLPFGLAAAAAFGLSHAAAKAAERAALESQAIRYGRAAALAGFLLLFVAQLTVDAGRAAFVAEPHRRSAWLAWWRGARLVLRRPGRALLAGASTVAAAALLTAIFLVLRARLHQTGAARVSLAFMLTELAVASVGWNRAARLVALTELMRADTAERARPAGLSAEDASGT